MKKNNDHYPVFLWNIYDIKRKLQIILPSRRKYCNTFDNYNPVFIVSCGRSGNTLLRRILNSSSEIYIPSEIESLGQIISLFYRYKNMPWNELVNLIISTIEYNPEFKTLGVNCLKELSYRLKKVKTNQRSLAYIINQFYLFVLSELKIDCTRWGDKTPMNSKYIGRIHKIFPQAFYVHLIRNGYDVAYSYSQNNLLSLEEAANRWKYSNKMLYTFGQKNNTNYILIRYEDLVNEPKQIIKRLCGFIKIEYSDDLFEFNRLNRPLGDIQIYNRHNNVYNPINPSSIGKGLQNISQKEIESVKKIIGKEMIKFDYPD
jgi:hypothetical protein